jgi:pectin lyase
VLAVNLLFQEVNEMKQFTRMRRTVFLSLALLTAWLLPLFGGIPYSVAAVSVDYPAQYINIATKDNSKVLTENGTGDGAALSVTALGSDLSPSWRFDWVGSNSTGTFFKLTNAQSGRLLTPKGYNVSEGTSVIMYGSESAQSQHWYVIPVSTDHLGNGLYYKIVNYSDPSLALTQGTSGMTLSAYTGADNQLWLLNSDGLQGFAGYCYDDNTGNIKAADIGGLFGETVEVSTFDELKEYATSDTPYTIIVKQNISVTELNLNGTHYMCSAGRIYVHSNKTIIGSYSANTLFNVQFCTSSKSGTGNNIIIKNFEMQHDADSNNNDSIVCYFGSGENIWVDHVTFIGHDNYGYASNGEVDEDKFLACCYDADYCTVSDCSFGAHKYGLILGYPSDDASNLEKYGDYPNMSLISNQFNNCSTRGPGLMRWGYYHSLNNYVNKFSMAYTVISDCKIYAENCVYENGGNVICDWNESSYAGNYSEEGSIFSGCNRTQQGGDSNSTANPCTWRPNTNYSYISLTATAAKTYCQNYSGCQSTNSNIMYLRYATKGVPSAGYTEAPSAPTAAAFDEGACYRLKNVNSGLYMQVAGALAANSTNVQQWGSDGTSVHDIWKLYSAGDGYYYITSCVGDGGTYVLDVAGKKTANGTNLDIYQYNGGTNQQFMLTANGDGSYKIRTRVTGEASVVEIADASTASGANVQQWEENGNTCQDWILEAVTDPGCEMDVDVAYVFENVNSGLLLEAADTTLTEGTNIQQGTDNGLDTQKWTLKSFGSGNYYWIRSLQDSAYALKADGSGNGSNIAIAAYSSKDSSQLFRFTKNIDGTYSIVSHASKDGCLVEVGYASLEENANVQQWEMTGSTCQKWNLRTEEIPSVTTVRGDINNDGVCTLMDLILLQKWLLAVPDTQIENPDAADLYEDGILDAFDLCVLKKLLLEQ